MLKTKFPAALLLALSGCAFPSGIHRIAMDYNEAVASIANEQTFLNIVRAKERMPQHYTSITTLRGKIEVTGSFKTSGSIKGDQITSQIDSQGRITGQSSVNGVDTITPELGGTVSTGPSFDVAVLDTQKFYLGITSSVPEPTFIHLLKQGWDRRILSYLLIERIMLLDANGEVTDSFQNDPKDSATGKFLDFIQCFDFVPTPVKKEFAFSADVLAAHKIGEIETIDPGKVAITGTVQKPGTADNATIVRATFSERLKIRPRDGGCAQFSPGIMQQVARDQFALTLRSPEGVTYFVGEFLRATSSQQDRYRIGDNPLFVVREGKGPAAVTASLMGSHYFVPRELSERGRTMQVVGLIQELVNLQKEASQLPSTSTVRFIPY